MIFGFGTTSTEVWHRLQCIPSEGLDLPAVDESWYQEIGTQKAACLEKRRSKSRVRDKSRLHKH